MIFSDRLSEWVIPQAVASGCFGSRNQIIFSRNDAVRVGQDSFSSTVQFVQLGIKDCYTDSVTESNVVIKFQPTSSLLCDVVRAKVQFKNEILMYSKILPMIDINGITKEIFGKYYCSWVGPEKDYSKDFIMLEDLSQKQYKLSSDKVCQKINIFLALSYIIYLLFSFLKVCVSDLDVFS